MDVQASVVKVCNTVSGKWVFVPRLPGWAPTSQTHFTGEGPAPPAPITRASGSTDLALAGQGDYPHSLCLWPGRASLPLLSFHKGQARRACCVRVSVARGSLTSFSPAKPRGPRRVCQLVGGHCSSSRQVKGTLVTQHWGEKAEGSLTEGQRELFFKRHDVTAA